MMRDELFELLKKYSYQNGEFKLSSGKVSEHYVDCKRVTFSGRGLLLASTLMLEHVEDDSTYVGGQTLGADPLVCGVAMVSELGHLFDSRKRGKVDALIVRKEAKGHGTGGWVAGFLPPPGTRVTLLEDVVTSGNSVLKAAYRLRDLDLIINRVVAIVDRKEGGEEALAEKGLELKSLFNVNEFKPQQKKSFWSFK